MKKGALILLGMFMMVSNVEAKKGENLPNRTRVSYFYNNAVNFMERGIEFFVFTNGDFDFNTHSNSYFKNRRKRHNNAAVRINRDYNGRIRSVGNIFINYDRRGNVIRIGNIFIKYHRGQLSKVGDLRVNYNNWGDPIFYGNVRDYYYDNGIRFNINFGDVCNYNDAYFYRNDFRRNYAKFREDKNFYYYKAKPNAKIGKRSTILKRRKQASTVNKRRTLKRSNLNSYRKDNNKVDKTPRRNNEHKINRVKRGEKTKPTTRRRGRG